MGLVFVDVEANGISPYSGVMTEFGAVTYPGRATFHGVLWDAEPDPDNPAIPRIKRGDVDVSYAALPVMERFDEWLKENTIGQPVFVSDNPAFDWQWISFYFDKYLGRNPFGHSGRRLGDFYAGLQRDFKQTQKWKRWRVTPHDHNPVNDAMGNVEAFEKLLELARNE